MNYSVYALRDLRLTIGQNIHDLRVQRKMTLAELSKKTGVTEKLLDGYELGKGDIGLNELFRIGCGLEVKLYNLLQERPG